jgi:hypothetical protein
MKQKKKKKVDFARNHQMGMGFCRKKSLKFCDSLTALDHVLAFINQSLCLHQLLQSHNFGLRLKNVEGSEITKED